MSSKGIHRTSNNKFSDFMQISNQHPQIEIGEAAQFCIISELVAYKLIFYQNKQVLVSPKLQEMCSLAI